MMATPPLANRLVFKICSRNEWSDAVAVGAFSGSTDDRRDGYIHLSTAEQATETARKYFSHCNDLLLIAFDTVDLGEQLRWEPSRGGALFPHLYASLLTKSALGVEPLQLRPDGAPDVAGTLLKFNIQEHR
jgi:uncharacterized protein (DUF952 family)